MKNKRSVIKNNNRKVDKKDKKRQELLAKKRQYNIEYRKRESERKEIEVKFFNFMVDYINKFYGNRFTSDKKNRKYNLKTIVKDVLHFYKCGISYKLYSENGTLTRSSLNDYILLFSRDNISTNMYWDIYKEYAKTNNYDKLKYILTDTSIIANKSAPIEIVARNKFAKNKNCIKLSLLTDINGVAIDIKIVKGSCNDCPLLKEHMEDIKINTNSKNLSKNNRYKPYFLADSGYHSDDNIKILESLGYIVLIPGNIRNTKDKEKIKKIKTYKKFTETEKKIYSKRIKIENVFANLKQFGRLKFMHEKSVKTYESILYFCMTKLLFGKIY